MKSRCAREWGGWGRLNREGKDEMTKASIDLQDLRRRLYVKAPGNLRDPAHAHARASRHLESSVEQLTRPGRPPPTFRERERKLRDTNREGQRGPWKRNK